MAFRSEVVALSLFRRQVVPECGRPSIHETDEFHLHYGGGMVLILLVPKNACACCILLRLGYISKPCTFDDKHKHKLAQYNVCCALSVSVWHCIVVQIFVVNSLHDLQCLVFVI